VSHSEVILLDDFEL